LSRFSLTGLKDYYSILGVPENAHEQEIKLAYRRLAKRYHPDVNPGDQRSEEKFKEIVEAYNTLSDPILKSAYDRKKSGRDLFSSGPYSSATDKNEKKDPRKKEYSEAELNHARAMHRKRTLAHMARRKNILIGMIITFILIIIGGGVLENYVEQQRKEEDDSVKKFFSSKIYSQQKLNITDVDSPYDSLFGEGVYFLSYPNNLVIYNYFSDAIICAVRVDEPSKTIRNEFMHPAIEPLVLRDLPNGTYYIKVYAGTNWDMKKKIPDGRKLGGFSNHEAFYRIHAGPFHLSQVADGHKKTHTSDTIWIDPKIMGMDSISRDEFFSPGAR